MAILTHKQSLQLQLRTKALMMDISYHELGVLVGESRQSVHQTLNSEKVSLDKIISLAEKLGYKVNIQLELGGERTTK
jgi:hypothetical protein